MLAGLAACLATGASAAGAAGAAGSGGIAPSPASAGPPAAVASTQTPYMGWNTYYGVGGVFDQATIVSVARALLHRGLAQAGYRIVWLDFGWASGARTPSGRIVVSHAQWPRGMRWLTSWLHRHGLLAGIYTDAGWSGCRREGLGSLGHYVQDADQFAAWGFDAVKVDFCGAGQEGLDPRPLYATFAGAVRGNSSHRRMIFNVCNFWVPGQINGREPTLADSSFENADWASGFAQSWRTDTDIGRTGRIRWVNVVRNLENDARDPGVARPGHWNDPDYLGPQLGLSAGEAQAQLTMWAIVAAPLMLGSDPRRLSASSLQMLENPGAIAIDQDPLGVQGYPIPPVTGGAPLATPAATRAARPAPVQPAATAGQVWVKPLLGGAYAVALLNPGPRPQRITTTAAAVGLAPDRRYALDDVWTATSTLTRGRIGAVVPADAAVLYRVTDALPHPGHVSGMSVSLQAREPRSGGRKPA